ncbi:MAG: LLM class flavin-dependent oxidoreductase [Chromatiales bacterium]|jgi:probable F420-dependent oxidoreductase|nr:LLM class flavin-dependent oxidoreductase [Chromatiales bacterium]
MNEVKFGIGLRRPEAVVADAQKAESLGYQFATTGEHVFFHGSTTNGLITLAAAAGATTTIELMSSITLVPLYPAALLARLVSTLDIVSGGRFHLGIGVGGEYPKEFEACGVPVNERGARTNEALEVLHKLMTETDVTFDGKFTKLSGVTMQPSPISKPHPPIWVSGRTQAAMRRCARYGTGWLPYMYTPERLAQSLDSIGSMAADAGRDGQVEPGMFIFFAVHEDAKVGVQMAVDKLSTQYNQDFSKLVGRYAIAGSPEQCIARMREYIDAGARTIILSSVCPPDYVEENERFLAEQVLPVFRESH